MLRFLYQMMVSQPTYQVDVFSMPFSSRDAASVRLVSPYSWIRGVQYEARQIEQWPYTHVGAYGVELETQRYQPRPWLTAQLNQYDLIQVVSGSIALANVARNATPPLCAFVATTAEAERQALLTQTTGFRRLWTKWMTHHVQRIEAHIIPKIDHIFAESHYTADLIHQLSPTAKLSVAVPGVDTTLFRPHPHGYQPHGYILAVGRFTDPRKNTPLLLQAYAQLHQQTHGQIPNLYLVGHTGISAADHQFIQQMGLQTRIQIHIDVTLDQLITFYQNASLFVLSSDEEGLGIVILEAMATGLPVISTRCGGPETCVTDGCTGLLTPCQDPHALAQSMAHLISDEPLRQTMSQQALTQVTHRFSIEAAARAYLSVYEQLLS